MVNGKITLHEMAVNGKVNLRHEVFVNLKVDLHELAVIGEVYLHGMRQL